MLKDQSDQAELRRKAKTRDFDFEELEREYEQQKMVKENQFKKIAQNYDQDRNQANQNMRDLESLDLCFLVDVTRSMDSFKIIAKPIMQKSLQILKQSQNIEINWAAICYQDFYEFKQLKFKYHEHTFTKKLNVFESWLDTIKFDGGGDCAEDIRGAMKQMCLMNWPSTLKIAILICDAPTHGKQFNGGCDDDHPNEDIRDAILKMIDLKIILIGLNFRKSTTAMYNEIQKIYQEKQRLDLFQFVDLQNLNQKQAALQMQQLLDQLTQMIKNVTILQNPIIINDEAMEALCQQNNYFNFETQPNVKTVDVQFNAQKVEIKEQSFENNISTIRNIKVPHDYQVINEGKWQCIKTKKPYASGRKKDVFLMKKINQRNELYVIKTPLGGEPYKTKYEAIAECRSHLICQRLMKKFKGDLDTGLIKKGLKPQTNYPKCMYCDLLILEESTTQYWIAERFFQGEYVRFNDNNGGFINDKITDLNKLAQAFSFYTYYVSDFNYLICDVQGVGNYFTDPAVNTIESLFDDTDMGMEGIGNYIINYECKKDSLCREILEIMDIDCD